MANKGNFRAPWHDYRSPSKYMITLKKGAKTPSFGILSGGTDNSYVLLSKVGTFVKDELRELTSICSSLKLWQYIVMPDHIHFLLKVTDYLDEPLGNYIARWKVDVNHHCGLLVFEQGFNDQIITLSRSLDTIFQYIKQNPYRLAVRFAYPDYFTRINEINIYGIQCQLYGNLNLLHNPFKDQVVCHRYDSEFIKNNNFQHWIYTAANGGVLVSPFISKDEKNVRKLADEANGKIILITNHRMNSREKPTGRNFELCEQGRLLIICPLHISEIDSRQSFLAMNDFAKIIAGPACQTLS